MNQDRQRELARLLAGMRRGRRQQSGLDHALIPPDSTTAYRIARMVEEELGLPVAGWKIAAMKREMQEALRTDSPIYGRIYEPEVYLSPASVLFATQCSPIPEAEYVARLAVDLPPRSKAYGLDEVTEAVASLHPGIEMPECHFIHDARFPPLSAVLADGAGGSAVCLGPAIEGWRERDIAGQEVVLSCNGVVRRRGTAAAALDHPMVPLTWLANELSRTGIGMRAGQVVSTGTLTGMLRPKAGDIYVADFGPFGSVQVSYV